MLPGPRLGLAGSVLVGDTPDLTDFIGIKMSWNGEFTMTHGLLSFYALLKR